MEDKVVAIRQRCGWRELARSKVVPVFRAGRVVSNTGKVDLCDGSIDLIWMDDDGRIAFDQVTTLAAVGAHREKMRGALDDGFLHPDHDAVLWAWDRGAGAFRLMRLWDDFLDNRKWRCRHNATALPWDEPAGGAKQERLR